MQDSLNFVDSLGDNTITIIATILGIIGSFVIAVAMFYWGRLYERRDSSRKELSDAKKEFISAFDDSLNTLRIYGKDPAKVFIFEMPKQKTAFNKFRASVARIKDAKTVSRLDEAWTKYYSGDNPHEKFRQRPGQEIRQARKDAIDAIEAIEAIEAIIDFVNKI